MKKNEIGSEFWNIPLSTQECAPFFKSATWFLSGRFALERIIADSQAKRNIRSALLPSWCCDSMILPFLKAGIDVQFYPVFVRNGVLQQEIGTVAPDTVLFLIDYFGYEVSQPHYDGNPIVIRDITHSVFTTVHSDANYYFGSLRKWCGFKTGGFAFGLCEEPLPTDSKYVQLRQSAMDAKAEYIFGQSDSKAYLDVFAAAEEHLEHCCAAGAYPEDIALASKLNVHAMKAQRRENATILMNGLQEFCLFSSMKKNDCPLFVPILVPNGQKDALRHHLIKQHIYCPVHWPISKHHHLDEKTQYLYETELSLVCDQRYAAADMERIVAAVRMFMKR